MDNLSKEDRKKNMQNIKSANTIPELKVIEELKKRGLDFETHVKDITGKPDIVFRKKRVVVFIDSDFWHGHPKRFIMPKTNQEYWQKKIAYNRKRDKIVNKTLKKEGWIVKRFWAYDIKNQFNRVISKIIKEI